MKHHYIPASYLKRWAGSDGKLCQFSRPHRKVQPLRVAPDGTGYIKDLYALHGHDDLKIRYLVETKFFQKVDQVGSEAISFMLDTPGTSMPEKMRYGWCVFLLSLLQRAPAKITFFNDYAASVFEEDAQYDVPYGLSPFGADILMRGTISERLISFIMRMQWTLHTLEGSQHSLLTCDSPLVTTDGLLQENAHIFLPVSPRHYFLAVSTERTRQEINSSISGREGLTFANSTIVQEAFRYVYGEDDKQLRFVENRMAPKDRPFPSRVPTKRPEYPSSRRPQFEVQEQLRRRARTPFERAYPGLTRRH